MRVEDEVEFAGGELKDGALGNVVGVKVEIVTMPPVDKASVVAFGSVYVPRELKALNSEDILLFKSAIAEVVLIDDGEGEGRVWMVVVLGVRKLVKVLVERPVVKGAVDGTLGTRDVLVEVVELLSVKVVEDVTVLVLVHSEKVEDAVGSGMSVEFVNELRKVMLLVEVLPVMAPGLPVLVNTTLVHIEVVVLSDVVVLRLVAVLVDVEVVTTVPLAVEYPEDSVVSVRWSECGRWWEDPEVVRVFVEESDSSVLEERSP